MPRAAGVAPPPPVRRGGRTPRIKTRGVAPPERVTGMGMGLGADVAARRGAAQRGVTGVPPPRPGSIIHLRAAGPRGGAVSRVRCVRCIGAGGGDAAGAAAGAAGSIIHRRGPRRAGAVSRLSGGVPVARGATGAVFGRERRSAHRPKQQWQWPARGIAHAG
eukprot:gene15448-7376_t